MLIPAAKEDAPHPRRTRSCKTPSVPGPRLPSFRRTCFAHTSAGDSVRRKFVGHPAPEPRDEGSSQLRQRRLTADSLAMLPSRPTDGALTWVRLRGAWMPGSPVSCFLPTRLKPTLHISLRQSPNANNSRTSINPPTPKSKQKYIGPPLTHFCGCPFARPALSSPFQLPPKGLFCVRL